MKKRKEGTRRVRLEILCVLLIFVLLISIGLFTGRRALISYADARSSEQARAAAQKVETQLCKLIETGVSSVEGVAKLMDNSDAQVKFGLHALEDMKLFSDVALLTGNVLLRSDGSMKGFEAEERPVQYGIVHRTSRILLQSDERVQIRVPLSRGGILIAWIDAASVNKAMGCAFSEDYDWAIYDTYTGAFLINHTKFTDNSYYDSLRELNQDARARVLMRSDNGEASFVSEKGKYFIAQRHTALKPWSVTMILPERLVAVASPISTTLVVCYMLAVFTLLIVLALLLLRVRQRADSEERDEQQAEQESDRILGALAKEARMTLLIYYQGRDDLIGLYDGLGIFEKDSDFCTQEDLIARSGIDESDAARIRSILLDLGVNEQTDIIVRCEPKSREERMLHFVFHSLGDKERGVFCSIRDCTREQLAHTRQEREHAYLESYRNKAVSIWEIDVAGDRWRALALKKHALSYKLGAAVMSWRVYSTDIKQMIGKNSINTDFDILYDSVSPSHIVEMAHMGQSEYSCDFRLAETGTGKVQWRRMNLRISTDVMTDDVKATAYFFDIDAEKCAELERGEHRRMLRQTLLSIRGIFDSMYYVDLEKGLCYTAKSHGGEVVREMFTPYKETLDGIVNNMVHADDRARISKLFSPYELKRKLTEGSHYISARMRICMDDETKVGVLIIQPASFENGMLRAFVASIIIDDAQ